jgi:predicted dehydrogenase
MCVNAAEAEQLVKAAKDAGVFLMDGIMGFLIPRPK